MPSPIQLAALARVVPAAQQTAAQFGVPASVTLAQWTFESSWGTSQLALQALNFFGVKAENLADPSTYMEFPTHEYAAGRLVLVEADFERYATAAASFADHGRLLSTATRYKPAMEMWLSPKLFAQQLQACGYSTSPVYASGLIAQMNGLNLMQYDVAATGAAA